MFKISPQKLELMLEAAKASAPTYSEQDWNDELQKVVVFFKAQEWDQARDTCIKLSAAKADGAGSQHVDLDRAVVVYNLASALHRVCQM